MEISGIPFLTAFRVEILALLLVVAALTKKKFMKPMCKCEICRSYLTSAWKLQHHNLSDWFTELLSRSPTGTVHIHALGCTVTANPANVQHMLRGRFDNYPKGKRFSTILGDLLGKGIFNVDGEQWMFQRKMAMMELGGLTVRANAMSVFKEVIEARLIPFLNSVAGTGTVVDLQEVFRRFAFDVICKLTFGLDPVSLELELPLSEFTAAFDVACEESAKRATHASSLAWRIKRLLNMGSERELKNALQLVKAMATEVIHTRIQRGEEMGKRDLLSRFMRHIEDEDYLRDIVINYLLAGRDTIASGLTSLFWLLARHPSSQTKIWEEIKDGHHLASLNQLKRMPYLHSAVHECLRLYPPVQFDSKFAVNDDVLPDGSFIQGGTRVMYHPYAMGRMETIWGKDCLEFKPERWLHNGVFTPANPFEYPVFQAGPRACPGKEIALLEMKGVVVALLRRFRFEVVDSASPLIFSPGLTTSIRDGLSVTIHSVEVPAT